MQTWMSTLDELLARPFGTGGDGRPEPHHVDLRVSQTFYDGETTEDTFDVVLADFQADRARLAQLLVQRYGPPERKEIRPYLDGDASPDEPGSSLCAYLADWFFDIDLWRVGGRGVVAEVGHYDKELPLQLMLVVGDLSDGGPVA